MNLTFSVIDRKHAVENVVDLCIIFEFSSRTLDWTFFGLPVLFFVRKCSLNNMFHWCGPLIKMLMGVPRWAKNVVVAVVVSSSFQCLMSQRAEIKWNCANWVEVEPSSKFRGFRSSKFGFKEAAIKVRFSGFEHLFRYRIEFLFSLIFGTCF